MLDTLRRAFQIPELRKRLLFTMWMLVVFRIGVHVPVPGVDNKIIQEYIKSGTIFSFLDIFSGGALALFSVFAMSITPYINASIIMNLLTVVIPKFEEWSKEGPEGRRKLTQLTRYGTVILALIQAAGITFAVQGAVINPGFLSSAIIVITLTAGTAFLMWLGEQITEHGIGNGISLLIFAGIISRLPGGLLRLVEYLRVGRVGIFNVLALVIIGAAVIALVVIITQGERRVPVQYPKRIVGRRMYGGQSTHIPMRVNQAGVIPVIFAVSVLALPNTIATFTDSGIIASIVNAFAFGRPLYLALEFVLIVFFTYFYTAITFNPVDVANNIKKYGGFIPGLRPGRSTAQYLDRILTRVTLVGAIFLGFIAILPNFVMTATGIPGVYFGGTSLLIVVGVALETMKQVESQLLMRHYEGFMR